MNRGLENFLLLIGRLMMGGVFLSSGLINLKNFDAFYNQINSFELFSPFSIFVVFLLLAIKIFAGLFLILGMFYKISIFFLIILMIFLTYFFNNQLQIISAQNLMIIAGLIVFWVSGPGKFSLAKFFK